ncbi:MAG: division/cell wall cluster transcriptional repressor MraZ [Lachnospiraceae bacterium]|nr:division/cell wall cluster transcriptional repressor MraZ [Lachnospiraceae bacterium]
MFMGEYNHTIDAKGRLIIPAKLREGLGDTFVVTKGLDGCLAAYTAQSWEKLQEKLAALPEFSKEARAVKRFYLAGAFTAEFDKQGRILLPANLREHAGLIKDVVLVGVGDKVEIWSAEKWRDTAPENIDSIAESLSGLGFSL